VRQHHRAGADRPHPPHGPGLPCQPSADGLVLLLLPQPRAACDQQRVDIVTASIERRVRLDAHAVGGSQQTRDRRDDLELVGVRLPGLAGTFVEHVNGAGEVQHLEAGEGNDGNLHGSKAGDRGGGRRLAGAWLILAV
jgi:hypothetical protein